LQLLRKKERDEEVNEEARRDHRSSEIERGHVSVPQSRSKTRISPHAAPKKPMMSAT
jgi:hypothetical protein